MRISLKRLPAICGFSLLLGVALFSCSKDDDKMLDPGQKAFFTPTQSSASYSIVDANAIYKIPVGLTSPVSSGKTKTVNITATSSTGAVEGTQYSYTKTLTFTPDKITDTIVVTGVYAQYLSGRKDVVKFTFADAGDFSPSLNSSFTLNISGPCFEGDIVLEDFLGSYPNTVETFGANPSYGPYTTTISSVTSTGPTTGTVVVTNLWDNGWSPISFTLDWTDPSARTVVPIAMSAIGGSNAGDLNSGYEGITMAVRPFAGQPGTFSWCNQTLTLTLQLGVTGVGFFGSLYEVNMER
ncbi:MAG: hypothetical protein J0I32_13935 [Sphingobacteriales bacterium]|nr:hypothetical protein [Sphingobacteriales bacterium]OJW02983.1 MAG: hypothetical protein BGO52_01355 [Sphingobacteriales bacterium 44-61]